MNTIMRDENNKKKDVYIDCSVDRCLNGMDDVFDFILI